MRRTETLRTLVSGIAMGESPRWREGRLWFCDWGRGQVVRVEPDGTPTTVAEIADLPICIDWLPDGRLLAVSGQQGLLLRVGADGALERHAVLGDGRWNEIAVDRRGNIFVNDIGFDFPGGEFRPGRVCVLTPGADTPREVAGGLAFPNGMAVRGDTLIVAESYAGRLTAFDIAPDGGLGAGREFAAVEGSAPDGIAVDADGSVWFADVPNQRCVRVAEGGAILDTVDADRGCFSCALGGETGRTLFITANEWGEQGAGEGVVYATEV
ncbi:SMP-30/gluconolactonase/LRE family protein [Asanoa sp. WMMD1127]|uniref:SMP-30/gluconolactonase/LRE family protein n=1 Tax=Asanoa sp. WMMD1127 TaxID=3016107 RepID=UPI0024164E7B|nr:SMP-30/gluconolactonase/LRE family protein [Asanoa sp. WMMD1127]MDG4824118.1 SMP-30/gluconolactonase/LRE family protein [Asanoa sp. WMMD1127]